MIVQNYALHLEPGGFTLDYVCCSIFATHSFAVCFMLLKLYSEDPINGPLNNGTIQITNFYFSVIQAI